MTAGNIVLVGFMGAGKTSVGHALAERLEFRFVDTDELVEREAGMTIAQIWSAEGEEGFREREHEAVKRACAGGARIVACGGGAVLQMRNYGILKGAGVVVYLRAHASVLRARLRGDDVRPLLKDPRALDRLLAERAPAYEAAADVIVDVDEGTPEEIADKIMEKLI
jgi:shikimate kinase